MYKINSRRKQESEETIRARSAYYRDTRKVAQEVSARKFKSKRIEAFNMRKCAV